MQGAEICYAELYSAKLDSPVLETGWSGIFRSSDDLGETMMTKPNDWRTPLIHYLENPGQFDDRKVRRQALKYVVHDNTLYRQTIYGCFVVLCLSSNQSKIAMEDVHEGIYNTH
jgi:hypothetical protein